jgi:hypothetical protein
MFTTSPTIVNSSVPSTPGKAAFREKIKLSVKVLGQEANPWSFIIATHPHINKNSHVNARHARSPYPDNSQ